MLPLGNNKIIYLLLLTLPLISGNMFDKVTTKQKSKNHDGCNIYVEINGNKEWKQKKNELVTIISKNSKCRIINIHKIIKNVNTRKSNISNQEFDVYIGTIINKNKKLKINIKTEIKNSNFKNQFSISNRINDKYIRNLEIKSSATIKNTTMGEKNKNLMGKRSLHFDEKTYNRK